MDSWTSSQHSLWTAVIPPVTRVGRQLNFLEPSLSSWISSSPLVKLGNRGGMTQISLQSIQVHFLYVAKIIWKENTQEIIMAKIPKKRRKRASGEKAPAVAVRRLRSSYGTHFSLHGTTIEELISYYMVRRLRRQK